MEAEAVRPLNSATFLALRARDADQLRRLHGEGQNAAVLARGREIASESGDGVVIGPLWDAVDRCLRSRHHVETGQPVFGRRDYDITLIDPAAVAANGAALREVTQDWMRGRFDALFVSRPGPVPHGDPEEFEPVWAGFEEVAAFFARTAATGQPVLFSRPSSAWRPARRVTGPDGVTRVVRPRYRPSDYMVDRNSLRALPAHGGSWIFDADLDERDGALYSWTEVERFIRGGRTWVRMTMSGSEYCIDVENADDHIGRIECVDPLVAYRLARKADNCPVILED